MAGCRAGRPPWQACTARRASPQGVPAGGPATHQGLGGGQLRVEGIGLVAVLGGQGGELVGAGRAVGGSRGEGRVVAQAVGQPAGEEMWRQRKEGRGVREGGHSDAAGVRPPGQGSQARVGPAAGGPGGPPGAAQPAPGGHRAWRGEPSALAARALPTRSRARPPKRKHKTCAHLDWKTDCPMACPVALAAASWSAGRSARKGLSALSWLANRKGAHRLSTVCAA